MLEKLSAAEARFNEIEAALSDAAVIADLDRYTALMKEHRALSPVVEKFREYKKASSDMDGAKELLDSGDAEMKELAQEELRDAKERLAVLEEELKVLLLPRDPNDDKNVIIEIRAGAGGEEAALFAGVLFRMYTMYADKKGFKCETTGENETGLGGFREISFMVTGDGAYSRFKFESGVHRVQRVPETETSGRIHTSTATVAVLPEAEEVEVELDMNDLEIETIKSSGAGGQHINKTESAVRMIHKPTGIVVECQDERSQRQNREKALRIMRSKLYEIKLREETEKIAADRKSQVGTGDRSERIRTYNFPQGRVSDHRIGLTLYSLDTFINGDLDEMIDALATAHAAEMLKEGAVGGV
jgi:peptide chain release factor 1